ncbi:MAG: metal-dependent hydrolase [Methanoregulaceae archaeon]|jgi:tetratricopeptide (TPR) repeat protein
MRKEEHLLIGFVLFGLFSIPVLILTPITFGMAFWAFALAAFGSVIPDIIEPAYHWKHRSYFHGTALLRLCVIIFLITGLITFLTIINDFFYYFYLISGFFLGYASHLLADSTTKMGIPETQLPEWVKLPTIAAFKGTGKLPTVNGEITEENKQKAVSLKEIGNNHYIKGDYQEALRLYEEGLKLDPTNRNIVHNKKMALAKIGSIEKESK